LGGSIIVIFFKDYSKVYAKVQTIQFFLKLDFTLLNKYKVSGISDSLCQQNGPGKGKMEELREAMRKWVTGVSVVTVQVDGSLHGMTVGSLVSVSIDPPRIAITLGNQTRTHNMVQQSKEFGVSILGENQQLIAEHFSGMIPDQDERMASVTITRMVNNIPVIDDALGHLACRVVHEYNMPASTLFVGEVLEARTCNNNLPLVYGNRRYHRLEL
jgi:flavin reductase (DIM6/NTAB) family NADH-FMN oxidoreductase RutF